MIIAYVSFRILQKDPHALIIVAPSDHLILDQAQFEAVCTRALQFAKERDALVTLGITPSYANTGYGYIHFNQKEVKPSVYKIKAFTEKPDTQLAKQFVSSGEYLWNSGIFVWKAQTIVHALEKFLLNLHKLFTEKRRWLITSFERLLINNIYWHYE